MNNNINICDGREKITINGDEGRVIYFNPADFNIVSRAKKASNSISDVLGKYKNIVENIEDVDEYVKILDEVDEKIRTELNAVFLYDVSSVVFGSCSPITPVTDDGKTYIEAFLEAVVPIMSEGIEKRTKRAEKNIQKHTARYE